MDKGEAGTDGSGDVVMQQYPSPTVDGQDEGPFYGTNPRDQQMDQLQDQEPPTPQHHSRPSVSAEELQLAAQLTRDLATGGLGSMMGSSSAVEEPGLDQQDPSLQSLQPLQGQERVLQPMPNQDPNLQSVLPHQEPPAPQSYVDSGPQAHLPAHVHIGMAQPHFPPSQINIPPRKRSKVSRACDECRRKKVKCDAASENGDEPCSNCRRSGIRCLFSRVPQKRGPSKGYIKELADRINSIEGKLGAQAVSEALGDLAGLSRRESADPYSPSVPVDDASRKRPYSSISGEGFDTPSANRHAGWASEPRPSQPYQTPTDRYRPPFSVNGLAPRPMGPKSDIQTPSRPAAAMDNIPAETPADQGREIDEIVFQAYLTIIHHVFPIVASNKARAQILLSQCPILLREAFIEALSATIQSFAVPNVTGDVRVANRLLADWEAESLPRSAVTDLVHLQTLLLMIVEADGHGPASLKGEHGGPAKSALLGRAVGLAYTMSLHTSTPDLNINLELDPDSQTILETRAWWTLVILDRWNAMGTATPLLISNDSVTISNDLYPVLGEATYRFILLAYIMGHWLPLSVTAAKTPGPGAGAAASANFNLNMELWRVSFPPHITPATDPVLILTYWHCRLLAYLFMPSSLSTDVLWASKELVGLLVDNHELLSPFNHHFTCLAAVSLLELKKLDKTRDEANRLLKELMELDTAPSPWDRSIRDKIAEVIRPSTSSGVEATASQSLQHLADLATATESATLPATEKAEDEPKYRTSDTYEDLGFDPRPMLRGGYLNALSLSTA